jgi:hypothetical protein
MRQLADLVLVERGRVPPSGAGIRPLCAKGVAASAAVDDADLVGLGDRRQPMGDDDGRYGPRTAAPTRLVDSGSPMDSPGSIATAGAPAT